MEVFEFNLNRNEVGNEMAVDQLVGFWPRCGMTTYGYLYWEDENIMTQPKIQAGWQYFSEEDVDEVKRLFEILRQSGAGNIDDLCESVIAWGSRNRKLNSVLP